MIKSRSAVSRLLAASAVLLCVATSANAQDKVLLRMNLHQGQTFDQGFAVDVKMSQTVQKQRIDMTMTTRVNTHNEVLNVDDDGGVKLKITYQSVSIQSHANRGKETMTLNYDSRKTPKELPALSRTLAAMVGQSFIVTISPRGKTLNVEGIDAVVQGMMAKDTSTVGRKDLEKSFKNSMLDQAKLFLGITEFSESHVALGQSWAITNITQSMVLTSAQSTLMSNQNDIATLAIRSNLSINPKASSKLTPDFPIHVSMSGTEKGVMRVDAKSGLIRNFELHQRMLGKVSITMTKSTFNGKKSTTTVTNPRSWPVYIASTTRGWTVKLPQ